MSDANKNSKIKVQDVFVQLSESFFLNKISLEFADHQVYALLGESGSGKSTLLRAIAGLLPLEGGSIEMDGLRVEEKNLKALSQKVGFMPQNYGLFPHMTAEENVSLQARLLGWKSSQIKNRLQEMMDLVLLPSEQLGKYPSQMSGGQRQRVALMRCMFLNQPVFLFDEPLSALDTKTKAEILKEWRQLFTRLGKLVIIVTHSLFEAKTLGDHILVMKNGELCESGSYEELSAKENSLLVRDFLSSSSI